VDREVNFTQRSIGIVGHVSADLVSLRAVLDEELLIPFTFLLKRQRQLSRRLEADAIRHEDGVDAGFYGCLRVIAAPRHLICLDPVVEPIVCTGVPLNPSRLHAIVRPRLRQEARSGLPAVVVDQLQHPTADLVSNRADLLE